MRKLNICKSFQSNKSRRLDIEYEDYFDLLMFPTFEGEVKTPTTVTHEVEVKNELPFKEYNTGTSRSVKKDDRSLKEELFTKEEYFLPVTSPGVEGKVPMSVSITQWPAAIIFWFGGMLHISIHISKECGSSRDLSLVILALLIIGGVELNPGPSTFQAYYFHRPELLNPQENKRREGTADMTGELFEVDVAMFLFLKGMFETESFSLATNVEWAGAFDDLVFKFRDKETKKVYLCFLQLKHKASKSITHQELCAPTGNFSLLKYYASYCDIRKEFASDRRRELFGESFDGCEFIIYTNTGMKHEDGCCVLTTDSCPERVLNSGGTNGRILCFGTDSQEYKSFSSLEPYRKALLEIVTSGFDAAGVKKRLEKFTQLTYCKELLKTLKDEVEFERVLKMQLQEVGDQDLWEQFMRKLKLYTHQAASTNLHTVMLQQLETYCGTSKKIFPPLKEGITEWWRQGCHFLADCYAPFWDSIMKNHIRGLVEPLCNKMARVVELRFGELLDVKHGGRVTHVVTRGTTTLSCVRVWQLLAGVGHVMVDSDTLHGRLDEVLAIWERGTWSDILVVEGGTDREDVVRRVVGILQLCPGKRLVQISGRVDHMSEKLREVFQGDICFENFTARQLDHDSQETLLACEVDFQDHPITLKSLVGQFDEFLDSVDADTVAELLGTKVRVGQKLADEDKCYISRALLRKECFHKEVFSEQGPYHFAVSGMSVWELQPLTPSDETVKKFDNTNIFKPGKCRYFVIDGSADFVELANLYENVLWLHIHGDTFLFNDSKGDVTFVRKHVDQNANYAVYNDMEEFMKYSHRVVLVVAEPGMGKSTELSHLALQMKRVDPTTWVVTVILNNHTDYLSQDDPTAFGLLLQAGKFDTEFQRSLFKHEVYRGGNVVVMFDGFDEISPNYADKVICMLRDLASTKIKKLWVTSRPVMRDKLEKKLSSLSFELRPFSEDDQKLFLQKFWKSAHFDHNNLVLFIVELLKLTSASLNDRLREFTGIPLQTRMLAEAFEKEVLHYCQSGEISLPNKLDLLLLYNRFVDRKWEVYYEKNLVDVTKVGLLGNFRELRDLFQQSHMACAVNALLDVQEVKKLKRSRNIIKENRKFLEKFKTGMEKTGIVVDVVNDRAVFAHRTFAEYFVALWFSENFEIENDYMRENFFEPNFQIVRSFFERILAQNLALHVAVLNQDISLIGTLLLDQDLDIDAQDDGGQTALHLAVMCCVNADDVHSTNIVRQVMTLLLNRGADHSIEDEVFFWRPLRLADRIRAWIVIDLLLERQGDSGDLVQTSMNIHNNDYIQDALRISCIQGYLQLITFLIDGGVSVQHPVTVRYEGFQCEVTMLHVAARHGHLSLVEFLVKQKADIETETKGAYERNALIWAAERGELEIVKFLTDNEANINAPDTYGNTAIIRAARYGKLEVFKFLLQQTDVMDRDKFGNNVLHWATKSDSLELVSYILNVKPELIDSCNNAHKTPLLMAAENGSLDVVKLLSRHADIKARDKGGITPLLGAARNGNLNVVKFLLEISDVTECDNFGNNVLHCSARSGNVEVIAYIVHIKPNFLDSCNKTQQTPLLLSITSGKLDAFKLLAERANFMAKDKLGNGIVHYAVKSRVMELVTCTLNLIPDFDRSNIKNQTPFLLAASVNKLEVLKLVANGSDPLVCDLKIGDSVLHYAARAGNVEVMKYLLDLCDKLNIDGCNKKRQTPLWNAAWCNQLDIVQFLCDCGADLHIQEKNHGFTALHVAARYGYLQLVQCLVRYGANCDILDNLGRTPLQVAIQFNEPTVVEFLCPLTSEVPLLSKQDEENKTT